MVKRAERPGPRTADEGATPGPRRRGGRSRAEQGGGASERPRDLLSRAVRELMDEARAREVAAGIIQAAAKGNARMAVALWERLEGKLPNPQEHSGPGGGPIEHQLDLGA